MTFDILMMLKALAAVASVIFGVVALIAPARTATAAGITADTTRSQAEIRASWGGTFLGLGVGALFLSSPMAYALFGIAYAATALIRAINAILIPDVRAGAFYVIIIFEIISAIIFLWPA